MVEPGMQNFLPRKSANRIKYKSLYKVTSAWQRISARDGSCTPATPRI